MGRAAGATATLSAIENYKEQRRAEPFAAAVSLSPFCPYQLVRIDAPVLLLIGEKDDWTTIAGCEDIKLIEALKYSVTTKIYPGVTHGFDVERFEPFHYWGGHVSEYNPEATQDAIVRIREFLGRHLKK